MPRLLWIEHLGGHGLERLDFAAIDGREAGGMSGRSPFQEFAQHIVHRMETRWPWRTLPGSVRVGILSIHSANGERRLSCAEKENGYVSRLTSAKRNRLSYWAFGASSVAAGLEGRGL